MFSNEIRSIRASLAGFTGPLNEEDQALVRLARANLEALAVQIDEWEGNKPAVSIDLKPANVAQALAGRLGGCALGKMGSF